MINVFTYRSFLSIILFLLLVCAKFSTIAQTTNQYYDVTTGNGNGLRFWDGNSNWKIAMGNSTEYRLGPVQNHSIKFFVNSTATTHGWTWGINGQTPIAALSNQGIFQLRSTIRFDGKTGRVGIGTTNPLSGKLWLTADFGSATATEHSNHAFFITKGDYYMFMGNDDALQGSYIQSVLRNQRKTSLFLNPQGGNVGIGTTTPSARLHVNGTSRFDGRIDIRENGNTDGYLVRLTGSTSPYSGSGNGQLLSISSFAGKSFYSTTHIGTAILGKVFNWGGNLAYSGQFINGAFKIARDEEPTTIPDFYVSTAGNVGIGTDIIPEGYKLAVKGGIAATRVTVKTSLAWSWPDYVFSDDYKLMPLQDVKQFVATNKHLPDVPCEKSVSENGIDVGEMQAVLLKKIEELTLYLIKQDAEINELKSELKELKK